MTVIQRFDNFLINYGFPILDYNRELVNKTRDKFEQSTDQGWLHKTADWIGKRIRLHELSHSAAQTALKVAPITVLFLSIAFFIPASAAVVLACSSIIVLATQPDLLSQDGKERLLAGGISGVLLMTSYKVAEAFFAFHVTAVLGIAISGAAMATALYATYLWITPPIICASRNCCPPPQADFPDIEREECSIAN
jgi:hypothetical protein